MRQIDKKENNKQPPTDPLLLKYFLQADDFNTIYEELSNSLYSFNQPYENSNVSIYNMLVSNIPIEVEPDGYDREIFSDRVVYTIKLKTSQKKIITTNPNTKLFTGFRYICKKSYDNSSFSYPSFEPVDNLNAKFVVKIYNSEDNTQILNQTGEIFVNSGGYSSALLSSYYKNFKIFGKYIPNWYDNMSHKRIVRLTNLGVIFNSYLNPEQISEVTDGQIIQIKSGGTIKSIEHPLAYKYLSTSNNPSINNNILTKEITFLISKNFYVRNNAMDDEYGVGTFFDGKVGIHNHTMSDVNISATSKNPSGFESGDGNGEGNEYTNNIGGPTPKTVEVSGTILGDNIRTKNIKRYGESSYTDTTSQSAYLENTPNSIPFYTYMYVD